MADYHFRWVLSYMGCTDYEVRGDGETYRIELRRELGDYERANLNGVRDRPDYIEAMIEPTIGNVRRCSWSTKPIPQPVIEAFNAWREREHADSLAKLRADPQRYGAEADWAHLFPEPVAVKGIYLAPDCSRWIENEKDQP